MIPTAQIKKLREALETSTRPLIFFDDDPDGLCSFLQFYKLNPESYGVIYKRAGPLDETFLNKVEEVQPDAIFILDIAQVSQDFLNKVSNVFWLDHHAPQTLKKVTYLNPMVKSKGEDNSPTSLWAHKITNVSNWLACVGTVGDWHLPTKDMRKDLEEEYPDLLPKNIKRPEDALFGSDLGRLARMFSFILKGHNKLAMTCAKVLTRIKSPYEILDQSSSQGKYIHKQFTKVNAMYEELKNSIKITDDPLILYNYEHNKTSLTSDLSNEILYENPSKFIIISRFRNGDHKCSLRSTKYEVLPILKKALEGLSGYGGGHLHACGANVPERDWKQFLENIKEQL